MGKVYKASRRIRHALAKLAPTSAARDIEDGDRRWAEASPTRSGPEGSSRNEVYSGSSAGLHRCSSPIRVNGRQRRYAEAEETWPRPDEATSDCSARPRRSPPPRPAPLHRPRPQIPAQDLRRPDRPGGHGRTLKNAFSSGRIAHASCSPACAGRQDHHRPPARRALNYESDTVHEPSVTALGDYGRHCAAIIEVGIWTSSSWTPPAAPRSTRWRELLDGVRYAPVEARYKVYIIDEVHMLSTQAFNAS